MLELPNGYREIRRVNLQKDKKMAVLLNVAAAIIMVVMFFAGFMFAPTSLSFTLEVSDLGDLLVSILGLFGFLVSFLLYIVAHELVHGVFIRIFTGVRAKYGFTGLFAYAGSEAFVNKRQYTIIALAPVVIFGVIFLLLNIFLPKWFWFVYALQIVNVSGAVGDFYITGLMCRMPADVLTNDEGVVMVMYSKEA